MDNKVFKADRWYSRVERLNTTYWGVYSFLTNTALHWEFDLPSNLQISKYTVMDIEEFYSRQTIVLAYAYVELIVKDFLATFFAKHPQKMLPFLKETEKESPMVSAKVVVTSTSISDLFDRISSERAIPKVTSGKFEAQLNTLNGIIKEWGEIPSELKEDLVKLAKKRNNIVHEDSQESVMEEDIRTVFGGCFELVKFLAEVANKSNILLDKFPVGESNKLFRSY